MDLILLKNFVKLLSVQPEPPPPDLVLQVEVVPEESRLPETIDTSTTTFSTTSTTTIATTTAGSIPRFYKVVSTWIQVSKFTLCKEGFYVACRKIYITISTITSVRPS